MFKIRVNLNRKYKFLFLQIKSCEISIKKDYNKKGLH